MLVRIDAPPNFVCVDAFLRPRLWPTAWSIGLAGPGLSPSTVRLQLRHVDKLYVFCDAGFGIDSLDDAISRGNATATQLMLDAFFLELTSDPKYTTTQVQCWAAVCSFIAAIALRRATQEDSWMSLAAYLRVMRRIRRPATSRFKFVRALPDVTLAALLSVADPSSDSNPFVSFASRLRACLIVHVLLLCGLRRGELLLLATDAMKHDVDTNSGGLVHWLNVTTTEDDVDSRSTRPSIKTLESHRQVPVSSSLAALYERYVSEARVETEDHGFLLTSRSGQPLSAESVNKVLQQLTAALPAEARARFSDRCGNKPHISPHDLRHTCATARYAMFMKTESNRELTLQRMRAFFGWSRNSDMPEVYARAAIQDDLLRTWNDLFDRRMQSLRVQAR